MLRIAWRATLAAVVTALCCCSAPGSIVVQQKRVDVSHGCERTKDNPSGLCHGQVLAAGWPFPFLYDNRHISAINTFGLEDDFKPGWFLLDAAIFGALPTAGAVVIWMRRRRSEKLEVMAQLAEIREMREPPLSRRTS